MPELPEVEAAAERLRAQVIGRTLVAVSPLHPSQRRQLPAAARRRAVGQVVVAVDRRGKHQLMRLADGGTIHAHFVLDGDWEFTTTAHPVPRFARVLFDLDDGTRVALTDPRAFARVRIHGPAAPPRLALGPDADDPTLTAAWLRGALAKRRIPIKLALLDQRLIAGIGNIYAAESLWRARISPEVPANALSAARVARLLDAIRAALADGVRRAERYRTGDREDHFHVYDREGEPCDRCGARIRRVEQGGRSTYHCPRCQRR